MGDALEYRILQCGVVGAGIAGLGAAIALSRAGHQVEVFETSQFKKEIGAAITLTPNANRVLDSWNFDADKAQQTQKEQIRRIGWQDGIADYQDSFEGVKERYGHVFNAFHRVDLHNGLQDMVLNEYGVKIRLGTRIKEVACDSGNLTLVDGTVITKDLLIIADGIKSNFVNQITDTNTAAQETGRSVFRTLIPMDKLLSDPTIAPFFENEPSGFLQSSVSPSGVLFVTYPCRADRIMNVAVFHSTRPNQRDANDWNHPATPEDVVEILDGFHPFWRALVAKADTMKVYTVSHRPSISRMVRGKAIVIGDAAHPMMPTHAQGGSMALEDAASLEILLANIADDADVQSRLQLFQQLRLPRIATTQILSNAMFYSKVEDVVESVRRFYGGPILKVDVGTRLWCETIRDFFYGYDVFGEARKALRYKNSPEGVPEGVLRYFGYE
jgi:salicylate hydroxylase